MAWEVKGDLIKTRWAAKVDPENVLPEYPTPQCERKDWQNLNGLWEYAIVPKEQRDVTEFEGEILVPFGVESPLSGVKRVLTEKDRLWYRRTLDIPQSWEGKRIILHFGAIDWDSEIYVNGVSVCRHLGGYTPISVDITDALNGAVGNELKVSVYDPTDNGWQDRGKQSLTTHGFWYQPTSGIWQTAWMEPVSLTYLKSFKMVPDIDGGNIAFRTDIYNKSINTSITVEVFDADKIVATATSKLDEFNVVLNDMKLWSPEDPFLYDVKIIISENDVPVDEVKSYVGMRKFSMHNDKNGTPRLFLNNKPYFMNGLLDQGFWPDGIYTQPCDEALIYDIQTMKDLGFNMLRKHIKTESARWYYHCDKIGMLVWQDMVSGGKEVGMYYAGVKANIQTHLGMKNRFKDTTQKAYNKLSRNEKEWRDQHEKESYEMMDALFNVTSLCCWVPFNEAWGQFDAARIAKAVKKYDPSRLVDHASGWYDQYEGDMRSTHIYILPLKIHQPDERAYVISEFGGYSLKTEGHTWCPKDAFGYRMFKSPEQLTTKLERLYLGQLLPLIPKGLSAVVYTEVSDVENEVNGLLTYDRDRIKPIADRVKAFNRQINAEYERIGILEEPTAVEVAGESAE